MAIPVTRWPAYRWAGRGQVLKAMRTMQRIWGPVPRGPGYAAEVAAFRERHAAGLRPDPATPVAGPRDAARSFVFAGENHAYRLFVPSGDVSPAHPLSLLVMLHGCRQDAADFARGTGMNAVAQQHGCIVLYPEQSAKANGMRCWNWFEPAHQAREAGEPGLIAALTRHVLAHEHADPARVYIAGLSAGGAMAVQVATLYPELFAAVGVHSGVPTGAARDVRSAFGAMRGESRASRVPTAAPVPMPTIVFHGDADGTVHPGNADRIADAALAAWRGRGVALIRTREALEADANTARKAVRTVHAAADGKPYVEQWAIASGPHAWSGGSADGSYTDPRGPHASAAMLGFMLQHSRVLVAP